MKKIIFSALALCAINAQELTKIQESQNLSLTIYNNNLAMVNEERAFNVDKTGKNNLVYEAIPTSVIFESIIPYFSKPTTLYSQNYHYDILSLNKLLEKHINKTISYKVQTGDYTYKKEQGVLLSLNPILVQKKGAIISGIKPADIIFSKIPDNLITKPSLVWKTKSQQGKQSIKLNYLTKNIAWKSDYVLNLDDSNTLNGWITITNNSGTTYDNAKIYCIAGDVKTSQPELRHRTMQMKAVAYDSANFETVTQKAFAGYHLYEIPFNESIKNKEKKQINFVTKNSININTRAVSNNSIYFHRFSTIKNQKLNQQLQLKNSKENGLGLPLPKGTIRVYKKDEKLSHFIGQDRINHTALDEEIKLNIGKFFDITQTIKQHEFKQTKYDIRSKYSRLLENKTDTAQVIEINESNYSNNIKTLENNNNCTKTCFVTKEGLNSFKYTIELDPKESFELVVDYEMQYARKLK